MTPTIAQILSGTPIWVFVLLAYLLWVGESRLKPGGRDLAKIWITPGIFIVWGLIGLFQHPGDFCAVLLRWAGGCAFVAALGLVFHIPMQAHHARGRVRLPGSALP